MKTNPMMATYLSMMSVRPTIGQSTHWIGCIAIIDPFGVLKEFEERTIRHKQVREFD